MHVPASAVSLARSMLWLHRAGATGVLRVNSTLGCCHVALVDGVVRAAVSTPSEATRGNLRARICNSFRWPDHELRFTSGVADVGESWLPDAPPVAVLILDGMRSAVSGPNIVESDRVSELTAWGRYLLEAAGEHAVLAALQRREAFERTEADGGEALAEIRRVLRAFGALAPRIHTRLDYTLLLRKRGELRRRAGARELLDFPPSATVTASAARGALRRLTSHLHPDCLGPDAPASARALSHEVMQALTLAAASLR